MKYIVHHILFHMRLRNKQKWEAHKRISFQIHYKINMCDSLCMFHLILQSFLFTKITFGYQNEMTIQSMGVKQNNYAHTICMVNRYMCILVTG